MPYGWQPWGVETRGRVPKCLQVALVMVMDPRMSKQVEDDATVAERPSLRRQRREDAVDVLAEVLWELWLRRHAQSQRQTPTWGAEESAHG